MKKILIDNAWEFRRGFMDSLGALDGTPFVLVDLPHDGMIGMKTVKEAEAVSDSGYFPGAVCSYNKVMFFPKEWEDGCVYLYFDGAMMHTAVDVNGCKAGEHHYGYTPFCIDITGLVSFGDDNRLTVNLNTGVQPASRWYTGAGLFRGAELLCGPKVHIQPDGVYVFTKETDDKFAFLQAETDICNADVKDHLAEVTIELIEEKTQRSAAKVKRTILVEGRSVQKARVDITVADPLLWDVDTPNLYVVKATATDIGVYGTHFEKSDKTVTDSAEALFGIRTVTVSAVRGLCINKKTVKLKGGCVHHDNGLLGAASLYGSEARKVQRLKQVGFNAIRTAHNPPSRELVEACDRLGMYIFDEAFDAWGIAKRTGDYSGYFKMYHESDLTAFVRRDRIHPSVIMWSTGNEIPERGGFNKGYTLATELAETIRRLDPTRPVSNGICSLWSGLDDFLARGKDQSQNAFDASEKDRWEKITEPFTNGLDVVGYNYMEDLYERDHELFPERVMLGSENFAQQIGFRWPLVEKLPYVIGDFTWTAWDYIGEAGIGKAVYVEKDDPVVFNSWALMPPSGSPYPWRLANDADFDITGNMRPQGAYRSVVWGSSATHLFSLHPTYFGKTEVMTMWGFPGVEKDWNFTEYTGKPVELVVYSNAEEVALLVNGREIDRKRVSFERPMPNSVRFTTEFVPGTVEAVSYKNGKEISRDRLQTSGKPAKIRLSPEKNTLRADGHDVLYVGIDVVDEDGNSVTDAQISLTATLTGCGRLAGFGTGNPKTDEDYTDDQTVTFRGKALAIVRSGYEKGKAVLTINAEGMQAAELETEIGYNA